MLPRTVERVCADFERFNVDPNLISVNDGCKVKYLEQVGTVIMFQKLGKIANEKRIFQNLVERKPFQDSSFSELLMSEKEGVDMS